MTFNSNIIAKGALSSNRITMKLFFIFTFLFLFTARQAHGQASICEICGPGLVVSNDDDAVVIPGQAVTQTCGELQTSGLEGQIPDGQCALVPSFIFEPCGCALASTGSTGAPISAPTEPPVDVNPPCDICGEGQKVTLFDVIVVIPGVALTPTCAEFEQGGLDGVIPASQCPLAPFLVSTLCGCALAPPTDTPTIPPIVPPSIAPTLPASTPSPSSAVIKATPAPSTDIPANPPCDICGEGQKVTLFDVIVVIPGVALTPTCAEFEQGGLDGVIPASQCPLAPFLVSTLCGCALATPEASPTIPPIVPPSVAPTLPASTPAPSSAVIKATPAPSADIPANPPCDICGEGQKVTLFDVIVVIPGVALTPTCAEFEQGGLDGVIPASQCPLAPFLVSTLCGCALAPPTDTPTSPAPTPPESTPTSVAPQESPKPSSPNGCYICGDASSKVTLPSATVDITGEVLTCVELEQMALDGTIPMDQCPFIPLLVSGDCGCESETSSPPRPTPAPTVDPNVCYVCGEGNVVGRRTAVLLLPEETLTCGELENRGLAGDFVDGDCLVIPQTINKTCECKEAPNFNFSFSNPECNVCGEGMMISNPDASIQFPGPPASCAELSIRGFAGEISQADCFVIPGVITDICGCTEMPAPSTSPTCTPGDDGCPQATPSTSISPPTSPTGQNPTVPSTREPTDESGTGDPPQSPIPEPDTEPPSSPTNSPPTLGPTDQVSSGCSTGGTFFGEDVGTVNEVDFYYEAITTSSTVTSALGNILTTSFEPALNAFLLATFFGGLCSRRLQARRRVSVVGLSSRPNDELLSEVICISETTNENRCTVVRGRFILYSEVDSDISETKQKVLDQIRTSMGSAGSGAFNQLDLRLVDVNWRTDPSTDDSSRNSDITEPPNEKPAEPATVPVWAWVLIGVGIAILNTLICFFVYQRRRMTAKANSDGDESKSGYGDKGNYEAGGGYQQGRGDYQGQGDHQGNEEYQGQGGYQGLGGYKEQGDFQDSAGFQAQGDNPDQRDYLGQAGYQEQDTFDDPGGYSSQQTETYQSSAGFSQTSSLGQGSARNSGNGSRSSRQSSMGDPQQQMMMNSIGNL